MMRAIEEKSVRHRRLVERCANQSAQPAVTEDEIRRAREELRK